MAYLIVERMMEAGIMVLWICIAFLHYRIFFPLEEYHLTEYIKCGGCPNALGLLHHGCKNDPQILRI